MDVASWKTRVCRSAQAAAVTAALAASGCARAGEPRIAEAQARAGLDAEMAAMASALGGAAATGGERAARQPCHGYAENGGGFFLTRFIRLPGGGDRLGQIRTQVLPRYRAAGWSVKERSMGAEATAVVERGLYAIRLILRVDGRGDVVAAGSTRCFQPA